MEDMISNTVTGLLLVELWMCGATVGIFVLVGGYKAVRCWIRK